MKIYFLVFLVFLILQNQSLIHGENIEFSENSSVSVESFRSTSNSKIHPILIQWQLSENQNEFAQKNNLLHKEDTIGVYIHMDNSDSASKIPSKIAATFDEKIAYAFVSSEQLDELSSMEFVERVDLPDLVRTSPNPEIKEPDTQIIEENNHDYLVWIIIGGIIITSFVIFKIIQSKQKFQT